MSISKRIRQIRKLANLTIKDLSSLINVPWQTIGSYEREERAVSLEYISKLHTFFNVNANWILTGVGEMYESTQKDQPPAIEKKIFSDQKVDDLITQADDDIENHTDLLPFNEEFFKKITLLVEMRLKKKRRKLPFDKKMKVAVMLYKKILKSEILLSNRTVDEFIDLAA